MSRSNKTDHAENPATKFFDWTGGVGELVYYDRDKKENIEVPLPFRFLVLDEVATVGGGIDSGDQFIGYWSNAIRPRDAKISMLTVRSTANKKTRTEMSGTWADIKAHLLGSKYIKGLYIAFFDEDGEMQLGYLKIRGAAMRPWIDFGREHKDIYEGAFSITDKFKTKKGTNVYYEPVFGHTSKVKDETNEAALALDRDVLQPYLTAYFAQQGEATPEYSGNGNGHHEDAPEYVPAETQAIGADYDDSLDDIPF